MKLSFYKASCGNISDTLVNIWSGCYGYSHCELTFSSGVSFSASFRENLVRFKEIDMNNDKWVHIDLLNIDEYHEEKLMEECISFCGKKYDYLGIFLYYFMPIGIQNPSCWYCSEICSYLLRHYDYEISPNRLAKMYGAPRQPFSVKLKGDSSI
jgi:hypothetical protein